MLTRTIRQTLSYFAAPSRIRRNRHPAPARRRAARTWHVEGLEDRTLLSGWAIGSGGVATEHGYSVAVDAVGDVYVAGDFCGTADFDPTSGTSNLTSADAQDIFVAKYTSSGSLLWARRAGGNAPGACGDTDADAGRSISVDFTGNVYVTGSFKGTADFGSITLTNNGQKDIFVTKLDTTGTFLWAKGAGSAFGFSGEIGSGVTVDAAANVYVAGGFVDTVDFDPGPSVFNLTSVGGIDAFVWKLGSDGSFQWAQRAGSTANDIVRSVAFDSSAASAVVTGFYQGTADFGSTTLANAGGNDIFIAKLDAGSGSFLWTRGIGAPAPAAIRIWGVPSPSTRAATS